MNKFTVFSCIRVREDDYDGPCLIMACVSDPSFMLFFPVSEDNAKIISYILDGNDDYGVDTNILGLYKTMIDSWRSSDRYLSGVVMDTVYDDEHDGNVLVIRLALSDNKGNLDSLVRVNFLHAILVAAMEKTYVVVSDELIEQMMPPEYSEEIDEDMFLNEEGDEEDEEDEEGDNLFDVDNEERKFHKRVQDAVALPEDKNIVDIARKIMSGKIQDKEGTEDFDSPEDDVKE